VEGKKVSRVWRTYIPFPTGIFIRDYLLKHGRAYIYEVWDSFRRTLKEMGYESWGSYDSFRKYFNYLQRLNLIRPVGEGRASRPWLARRRYFELVPENADVLEAWSRPQVILYPATIYGRRRYRKKLEEARARGITVEELALLEHPEILEVRRRLGIA
jgi:hypothetical protein